MGGGGGVCPKGVEKKIQSFKFECLKWPILAEMIHRALCYSPRQTADSVLK